jgi:hypothetical protein
MYKKASDGSQDRTERRALFSRTNDHGIDPSAFKDADDLTLSTLRDSLVMEKKQVEAKNSEVRRLINDASAVSKGYRSGALTPPKIFRAWQRETDVNRRKMFELEQQIFEIKSVMRSRAARSDAERDKRFERMFMRMAKELLARAVYDRIVTTTIHRVSEEEEAP